MILQHLSVTIFEQGHPSACHNWNAFLDDEESDVTFCGICLQSCVHNDCTKHLTCIWERPTWGPCLETGILSQPSICASSRHLSVKTRNKTLSLLKGNILSNKIWHRQLSWKPQILLCRAPKSGSSGNTVGITYLDFIKGKSPDSFLIPPRKWQRKRERSLHKGKDLKRPGKHFFRTLINEMTPSSADFAICPVFIVAVSVIWMETGNRCVLYLQVGWDKACQAGWRYASIVILRDLRPARPD